MKTFLSGWQATNAERERKVAEHGYMKARCYSFAMIQSIPGMSYFLKGLQGAHDVSREFNIDIMMDSGVVSWRSFRNSLAKQGKTAALAKVCGEDEFIQLYVDYVKAHAHEWDIYITIDLERVASSIYDRHCKIEAMGIKPVPVFHGDDSADIYVKKYADLGHKLMCLGSAHALRTGQKSIRHYFASCFEAGAKYGMQFHGLAVTSPWGMLEFDWYSVDSSSWSRVAGYGGIQLFDSVKNRMTTYHISERATSGNTDAKMNDRTQGLVREHVKALGYDYDMMKQPDGEDAFVERHKFNSRTMWELTEAANKKHGVNTGKFNLLF